MHDEFTTIQSECKAEMSVQGSRFIATAVPVTTKAAAEQCIAEIRKAFWDATHNCYAYRLGTNGLQFRFNDDGEPSGTAGKPILAAIDSFGFTDLVVVVTRYFGGTKLGVGGLVKAYGAAAHQVLARATALKKNKVERLVASFPHSHIGNVMHVVSTLGARIVDTLYDEDVHATLEIRVSKVEELKTALLNRTKGNIALKSPLS